MSEARFDELIHVPTRLHIVALLAGTRWAEFRFVRDRLAMSDSNLSKHVSVLEAAGYVQMKKDFVGKRARTRLSLTKQGQTAFHGHVAALHHILDPADEPASA
ncbi:MAG: transcriptional regulator [Actinomycetota bacterium]|nr:transcriptional regulator [Actinomycetota bacterium]